MSTEKLMERLEQLCIYIVHHYSFSSFPRSCVDIQDTRSCMFWQRRRNVDVWQFMVNTHSVQTAVIASSSVYNEWIKRLWRDVYHVSMSYFINWKNKAFWILLNDTNIYRLHFPLSHLQDFTEATYFINRA